jgi:hypothetical protein
MTIGYNSRNTAKFCNLVSNGNMNTKLLMSYLLLMCLLSPSCSRFPDCEAEPLTVEIKKWMPYSSHDAMYFESALGRDTLTVSDSYQNWVGGYKCEPSYEAMGAYLVSSGAFTDTLLFAAAKSETSFSVPRNNVTAWNPKVSVTFNINERTLDVKEGSGSFHESVYYAQNGRVFNDVVIASCPDCSELQEIAYAVNIGVISYKAKDVLWMRIQN